MNHLHSTQGGGGDARGAGAGGGAGTKKTKKSGNKVFDYDDDAAVRFSSPNPIYTPDSSTLHPERARHETLHSPTRLLDLERDL